jgi:NDP-sugar pyrophosphorylase family protein
MDRLRLTITLKGEVLTRLDEIIDGVKIRNRSHAIEYLLSQSLAPKVSQAVILAGGPGVKMRPLTYEVPKPLIPVRGRPLIEYTIELLREAGIREIILAIGHLGEKIKEEVGGGRKYGVKVSYSEEESFLGSAGALRNAREFILDKPFLVINGDVLIKIAVSDFIQFHQEDKYLATIALSNSAESKDYGSVLLRGEKIIKFLEKKKTRGPQLINAGLYIFNPQIFEYIPKKGKACLEDIFVQLAKEGKLAGFPFEGAWFEVSTPANYERAIKEW